MLSNTLFRPWRPIWDAQLRSLTQRLDELVAERQRWRQTSPQLVDPSDVTRILLAVHSAEGRVSTARFVQEKIEPLLRACVWPRWLLLEAALDHAASAGELHLAALILRTQIEELDVFRVVAEFLSRREEHSWDGDAMANAIRTLANRVLPRLQSKTGEQLVEQASDAAMAATRPEPLGLAFDQLGEYVHPNYGSHVLSVRPHGIEAAEVLVKAFVAVYEAFLSLPWAKDGDDSREVPIQRCQEDLRNPFLTLADETIPRLKPAYPAIEEKGWDDAAACFRHHATSERKWPAHKDVPTDVEAIRALREHSVPSDSWPEAFRTDAGRNMYAFLVADEHRLAQDAARLKGESGQGDEKERLRLMVSALTFAINVTEYKLDSMAIQAARLINAENAIGATLAVRSMLEHHAIAIELGTKLQAAWENAEKSAPTATKVSAAFDVMEKQIARVLAGSSTTPDGASPWRTLWKEIVQNSHNVLGPIRDLDVDQSGFLKTYGLLSHIVHGTVCTGGDLLGSRTSSSKAGQPILAQLTYFLGNLCSIDAMLDRQAASMLIASKLDTVQRDAHSPAERIQDMRLLDGQQIKPGRDIFGCGTQDDPICFREGLLYHDAFYHYLKQEKIDLRNRRLVQIRDGFGDCIETHDGRELYFLNRQLGGGGGTASNSE